MALLADTRGNAAFGVAVGVCVLLAWAGAGAADDGGRGVNVAVTARAWPILSWHGPLPPQGSDQPSNVEPLAGVAVSVTSVSSG